MAVKDITNRPIRPDAFSDDESFHSDQDNDLSIHEGSLSDTSDVDDESHDTEHSDAAEEEEDGTPQGADSVNADSDHVEPSNPSPVLDDISFGALAQAAATLAPRSRKRKHPEPDTAPSPVLSHPSKPSFDPRPPAPEARTSKHAPQILSSRKPVSRSRQIFSPPPTATHARDPRFDPTITSASHGDANSTCATNRNYAFLSTYQASEIQTLKAQIKNPRTPTEQIDALKRQVMSLESKVRNAERVSREDEVRRKHREEERSAIREGRKSKPFYLKKGEVRKRVEGERVEGMTGKQREKMEVRKRKREKTKEARGMPRVRRGTVGES